MNWMAFYDKYYENIKYYILMACVLSCLKKYLNGKSYVEVKGKRYSVHPTKNILLGERKEPNTLTLKIR